jgi:hypothetical protein
MQEADEDHPTWDGTIAELFAAPDWVDTADRAAAAARWRGCMADLVRLDDYASVKASAVEVYGALHSQFMPLGEAAWPAAPLDIFRTWVNQGSRRSSGEPVVDKEIIPSAMPGPSKFPTWIDDVAALFSRPFWIEEAKRSDAGERWRRCMKPFLIDLLDHDSVSKNAVAIYDALSSEWMPLNEAAWPDSPLEIFRTWTNQGCRGTLTDPIIDKTVIPQPAREPIQIRVRRDLRSLSQAELDDYRMRLDDRLRVGDPDPASAGQIFSSIHGIWCLHYQEAFLFWHRAYLMAFEREIGCAIPYWNWYAQDAADDSPAGGLPQAFKDETYVHPLSGEERPNPLRYAAAMGGASKACIKSPPPGVDCRWVQRDPILYTSGDDRREERREKLCTIRTYQRQVQRALAFASFSHQEGTGYPWANIQSFDPPAPDCDYVYRNYDFDGAYEQPHDNFHGWVGPDMGDNSYTAFDPVFWSYHANIDRIFEIWLRAHPRSRVTANFPLHPFVGPRVDRIDYTDSRRFIYTTIGDLAKDSRGLGYDFGPPVAPDVGGDSGSRCPRSAAVEPRLVPATVPEEELLVIFDEVVCTFDSFAIDVFIGQPSATPAEVSCHNPNYVGRLSRIGMGQADARGRCVKRGVPRILDATPAAEQLGIGPGTVPELDLLVTALADGRTLSPEEVAALPGFGARIVWAKMGCVTADATPSDSTSLTTPKGPPS